MKPIKDFFSKNQTEITHLLTDIDDTITLDGRIPASAFKAMEDLNTAGIKVIPITGRPAGWCDHIARMWPVEGVVGENGAFYFAYDNQTKKMIRRYFKTGDELFSDREKLAEIREKILESVPGCRVSADQAYREADLAIDFAEDVPVLERKEIDKIVEIFEQYGACAKVSSIHVNGWFGDYNKLSMTKTMFKEVFDIDLDTAKDNIVFSGDSPNDEPMFEYFPNSVGVANVLEFRGQIEHNPAWVTEKEGGLGFTELAAVLLQTK